MSTYKFTSAELTFYLCFLLLVVAGISASVALGDHAIVGP